MDDVASSRSSRSSEEAQSFFSFPMMLAAVLAAAAASAALAPTTGQATAPSVTAAAHEIKFNDRNDALSVGAWDGSHLRKVSPLPWPAPTPAALCRDGVVRHANAISRDSAESLRQLCEARLAQSLAAVDAGGRPHAALAAARLYHGFQRAGEVCFNPSRCVHAVRNTALTVSALCCARRAHIATG